jgi:hypothetical protein
MLRDQENIKHFFENVVLWGAFSGPKGVFFHGILKKPAKFRKKIRTGLYMK